MKLPVEICILAGGLSSRMGRDKSTLRLGQKTLLAQIRQTAKTLNIPVRVIRRDLVPRCGPLGGIYTALKTSSADAVLFLACDMPHITANFLKTFLKKNKPQNAAFFTSENRTVGFPFLMRRKTLSSVEQLLAEKNYSLQSLAHFTQAKKFRVPRCLKTELTNLNTPADLAKLKTRNNSAKRAEAQLVN